MRGFTLISNLDSIELLRLY